MSASGMGTPVRMCVAILAAALAFRAPAIVRDMHKDPDATTEVDSSGDSIFGSFFDHQKGRQDSKAEVRPAGRVRTASVASLVVPLLRGCTRRDSG